MKDENKTKEQLVNELTELRQRVAELEALEAKRKRAEEEIRQRTAQFVAQYACLEAILHNIAEGIIGTDADGKILQINPVARTWLTHSLSLEDAHRLQETVRDLARRAAERPETVLELTGLDLELKTAPISKVDADDTPLLVLGEPTAVVAIHDISELKALDRVKTNFVKNASHELRTPIATTKLYAHLIQQTPPEDEKWGMYLDALLQEVDIQAQLGEDILQLSHIYAGQMQMKRRRTSLNELTEATFFRHQSLAWERGLILEHNPAKPGSVVAVDTEQMMHVLNSLVRDAIRYTPEGGQVIVANGQTKAEGRIWATVAVSDTGEGIPEEDIHQVFKRLFREGDEEPQSKRVRETGLRLMVVKEIVELHGGQVTVESPSTEFVPSKDEGLGTGKEGIGTTFTIWLPLTD